MRGRGIIVVVALALVLGWALVVDATEEPRRAAATTTQPAELVAFESCAQLRDAQRAAQSPAVAFDAGVAASRDEAAASAPAEAGQGAGAGSFDESAEPSATNNQVAGVDEADLVKLRDRSLAGVRGERFWVLSLDDPSTRRELPLPGLWAEALFLRGSEALVIARGTAAQDTAVPASGTTVVRIDLAAMQELERRTIDGGFVEARMTGDGTVRLVVSSFGMPATGVGAGASVIEADGAREALVACDDVVRAQPLGGAPEPAGAGALTTIVSVAGPLREWSTTAVAADAGAVYATSERLYVASNSWGAPTGAVDLHAFAIPGDEPARPLGAARIPGTLLNQYSMDEHDGVLRVAVTTMGVPVPCEAGQACAAVMPATEAAVLALRPESGRLIEVGRVGGLGVGEEIKAVRFLGDTGYVVTFRQTDPLYVVDLADPARPVVRGELKVPGFSSYLHPVADGRLLGAGSEADPATGQVTGAKVSLYDVADPLAPDVRSDLLPAGVVLSVANDPRAFAWDPASATALLPYEPWWDPAGDTREARGPGVLVVAVDGDRLVERGRLVDPVGGLDDWSVGSARRAFVAGDRIVTVSDAGVGLYDPGLARTAWVPFS